MRNKPVRDDSKATRLSFCVDDTRIHRLTAEDKADTNDRSQLIPSRNASDDSARSPLS